jgi:hypothetical protein
MLLLRHVIRVLEGGINMQNRSSARNLGYYLLRDQNTLSS